MNRLSKILKYPFQALLAASLVAGCKPNNAAPTPLAAEQIPTEMNKAFAGAKPETKAGVGKMLAALESKDYPVAYQFGQYLSAAPDITKRQLLVTARAMLEINSLLQQASAQGDPRASGFIVYQKHNR